LDLALAVGENITKATFKKEHTFIYFAKEIEKAADWAIEAFAIVNKRYPDTTLRIVGGYQTGYKRELDERLSALGITERVTFTGSLPTHDDVINEVRKSTFAVLPLKIDLIAGTIREAMANGIPVVTTITPATPELNEKRKSIMLSEKGDFNGMANNMMELIENKTLAEQLQANAYETLKDRYDNETIAKQWHDSYFEVLEHMSNGTPISLEATNRL
jgi:poly(glycerol-phosphate) alpha-glucosyltransferase